MPYKYKDNKQNYHKVYHKKWYLKNKIAVKAKQAKRRSEIKEWFKLYKSTLSCKICKENHPATLDFHHKDRTQKENLVSSLAGSACAKERILEEVSKCEVLCANCHRKLHWDETNDV